MSEADATGKAPAVARAPVKALGVLETLGWAVVGFVLANAAGTGLVYVAFPEHMPSETSLRYGGTLVALVTLITNPVLVAFFALIARWRAGRGAAAYLGLTGFRLRDLLVGVLAIAALAAVINTASWLAGLDIVPSVQTDMFTSARADGWLLPLLLAIVVVGPIGEEVMFRGFLFRGWVTLDQRGVFAVIVITQLWTAMHVQYDWYGMSQVFLNGLVLAWVRWRSGSTTLTIVLHVLINLESTLETMLKLRWLTFW
jgi:hypothetical protein